MRFPLCLAARRPRALVLAFGGVLLGQSLRAQVTDDALKQKEISLRGQLQTLRAQKVPDDAPEAVKLEEQLLDVLGTEQDQNRVQFEHSKGIFKKSSVYQIPVLFATDRAQEANGSFGSRQSPNGLSYGKASVTLATDLPLRPEFVDGASKLSDTSKVGPPVLSPVANMGALISEISSKKTDSSGKARRVLLFVHGYKNTFDEALEDAATLAADAEFSVIPIAYCWPSAGTYKGYPHDEDQERTSEVRFNHFLDDLVTKSPVEVVVVAHSMGSRLMTAGLFHMSEGHRPHPQLKRVVFAAADIAKGDFTEHWSDLSFHDVAYTFYSSSHDSALMLSYAVHDFQRLGDSSPSIIAYDGTYSIDASSVDSALRGVGHSYVFNSRPVALDIGKWINTGSAPDSDARRLTKAVGSSPVHYFFP